jgi:hypothetical protein
MDTIQQKKEIMMKANKIFNWRQVSTALSGNTESVRSYYKGDKYNKAYQELIDFAEIWLKKYSKSQTSDVQKKF